MLQPAELLQHRREQLVEVVVLASHPGKEGADAQLSFLARQARLAWCRECCGRRDRERVAGPFTPEVQIPESASRDKVFSRKYSKSSSIARSQGQLRQGHHFLDLEAERWPHPLEHEPGDDKWNSAGLTAAQGCPRRRAGVACDERTTDAVGNPCSPHIVPPDQADFGIAGSDAKYALSGVLPPCAV